MWNKLFRRELITPNIGGGGRPGWRRGDDRVPVCPPGKRILRDAGAKEDGEGRGREGDQAGDR